MSDAVERVNRSIGELTTEDRRRLLARLLEEKSRGETFPVSFAQERLWFLEQLAPGTSSYNISTPLRIANPIDVDALRRSLDAVVARHESLRTTFRAVDGRPVQVVTPHLSIPLRIHDVRHLAPEQREAEASRLAEEEARLPFDLAEGPLLRAVLVQLGPSDHLLILTMHHIVSDGWSMGIFFRELGELYTGAVTGAAVVLPDLPIQYPDFAVWQRKYLSGDVLKRQLDYWKLQLTDLPALDLPTDYPRPTVQSFRGAAHPLLLPGPLTAELRSLGKSEDATLFMTLLAGFQALLARYTGQEEIVVGTYIAGRNRAETEGLIGFFINTLLLRTSVAGIPTFRELLGRVREVALGAFAHQDLPFAKLVEEIQPDRDLSRNPLFQVVFHLFNAPTMEQAADDGASESTAVERGTAIFDLVFSLTDGPDGLSGEVEYSTDLFEPATIGRMAGHFQTLLAAAVARPDVPISDLPLLDDDERRTLLSTSNAGRRIHRDLRGVADLFEDQVAGTPDATAFICEGRLLTYRDLDRRANQLAHHLRSLGAGPEVPVGVCLERSLDLAVTVIALFKAGAAYLPLDPAHPAGRLGAMAAEVSCPLVVTTSKSEWMPEGSRPRVVLLDTDSEEIGRLPATERPETRCSDDQLAYVLYTSGSTGTPKPVAVEHRAMLNRLAWMWEAYPFGPDEVACQKTSVGFVDSIWELLGALLQGTPTVIVPDAAVRDVESLVRVLAEHRVTRLWLVPSLLRMLLDVFPDLHEQLPALDFWVSTGDDLDEQLFERFCDAMPGCVLFNLYGTSEVWDATWYDPRSGPRRPGRIPIGRPIANVDTYVLDGRMQPVPVGVPGELWVGGAGLARGYLHQPELTAAKFVDHPFDRTPGRRIYRTGDLVRWGTDGNLQFIGRVDRQVKLHGHRIEPAEIEVALTRHPGVKEAVVVKSERPGLEPRLVAYVVQDPDHAGSAASSTPGGPSGAEHVPEWQQVWDATYRNTPATADGTFNTVAFVSSYTGLPMPAEEVREWVDQAVARVEAWRPRRVLEIGCGPGLLLFPVAPGCTEYTATDFSAVALDQVRLQLEKTPLAQVRLLQQDADDFSGLGDEGFDAVVLNSVIQYFPSVAYLLRVLEGAVAALAPGGVLFVGDVRSLPLLEAFHASVELHRAADDVPADQLRRRVRKRMINDQELVIDPALFAALAHHLPRVTGFRIEPKRGRIHNEFTRFRYDVAFQVGGGEAARSVPPARKPMSIDWKDESLSIDMLPDLLRRAGQETLQLTRVPNSRVVGEVALVRRLSDPGLTGSVADLRQLLGNSQTGGIDPEHLWELGTRSGVTVDIRCPRPDGDDCYDVLLSRSQQGSAPPLMSPLAGSAGHRAWSRYANNPRHSGFAQTLVPALREQLQAELPPHMVPATFVLIDTLPRTAGGKIDRRALVPPDEDRPASGAAYAAPASPVEEMLAGLYADVLGIDKVGTGDNFFTELGGHSLLATQLASRVRDSFHLSVPLRHFFEAPTVAGLAAIVEGMLLEEIEGLSEDQATDILRGGAVLAEEGGT